MAIVTSVTCKGQATIPEELRIKHGIEAPGKVLWTERDGAIVVEHVPTLDEAMGMFRGLVKGKTGTEVLLAERRLDKEKEERRWRR